MNETIISWADATWNPVIGCVKISEGCRNCYAERIALKFGHTPLPWTKANAKQNIQLKPHKLNEPSKLKKPSRIFVNSMSDLFQDGIPDDFVSAVFATMNSLPQHIFQLLTKRPKRAAAWSGPWTENIWMGTSIENEHAVSRISHLRDCGAAIKFISFEPLINAIAPDLTGIDWIIVGGESGPRFRPMPHSWARVIQSRCAKNDIPFFFKQSSASRTETGTSLRHEDGTFWKWDELPLSLQKGPLPGQPHTHTYEPSNTAAK